MRIVILLFLASIYNLHADDKGFSLRGIVLEKSDFDHVFKVLKAIPAAELLKDRKEERYIALLCFITRDNAVLKFWLSNTTRDLHVREIDFYIQGHSHIQHFNKKKCSKITLQNSDLKFKNKIGLNTEKQAVYDHLGNPIKEPSRNNLATSSTVYEGMEKHYFPQVVDNLHISLTVRVEYNEKNLVNRIAINKISANLHADDKGFSLRGIVLEKSDFDHVFKVLEAPKIELLISRNKKYHHKRGKFICFITRDNAVLEFWSSDTMALGKYITEINFFTPGHRNIQNFDQKKCSKISLQSSDLKFKNKIGLNTEKQAVYNHLGNPKESPDDDGFSPRSREFQGMEEYYSSVNVWVANDRVRDNFYETLRIGMGYNKKNLVNMISVSKTTHGM